MKSEKLMDYIGQIDDSIIVEADIQTATTNPVKLSWIKWVSIAAVAVACLVVAIPFMLNRAPEPIDYSSLPKLAVSTDFGTMGFEGYMAYNIEELQNGNPWTANGLTTMPVFNNPGTYSAGVPKEGLSPDEMLAEVEEITNLFGLEIISIYTTPTQEQISVILEKLKGENDDIIQAETTAHRATAECNGAKVEVQKSGSILLTLTPETANLANDIGKLSVYNNFAVAFDYGYELIGDTQCYGGLPLPDGLKFSYDNVSREQAMEISEYLFSKYGAFTGIRTPGYDVFADYTYSGVLTRLSASVFENAGSLTERVLNYHFNRLQFDATDLGGLGAIRYYNTDLSQKIGDYPIITANEARTLLLNKRYITTVPEALPGGEYIAHVELTYRTSWLDTVLMPYYKFLVEMPTMQRENGLKTFGVFYVPAVQAEFLENMPVRDDSFD